MKTREIGTSIAFRVLGDPVGEPRHRYDPRSGRHHPDDRKMRARHWKMAIRSAACGALEIPFAPTHPVVPAGVPVAVWLVFMFPRPKFHFVARDPARGEVKKTAPHEHTAKPDADNLAKAVLDALGPWPKEAIFWSDDSVVSQLTIEKRYTALDTPGVRIQIRSPHSMTVRSRAFLEPSKQETPFLAGGADRHSWPLPVPPGTPTG